MKVYIAVLSTFSLLFYLSTAENKSCHLAQNVFSVIDTLNKYTNSDSLSIQDEISESTLEIRKANEQRFAVWTEHDSLLVFFMKEGTQWKANDTLELGNFLSSVEMHDLNGDSYQDIQVASYSGSAHNTNNVVFLYNPAKSIFEHNYYYNLTNISYDRKGKFIRSSWSGGVVHPQTKTKYLITGDSLTLNSFVKYYPGENENNNASFVRYYQVDGELLSDSISGKQARIWKKFERALWNSEKDPH